MTMTLYWALFALFLIGYATLSGAVLWHLNTYSFSRSGRAVSTIFTLTALLLGILSIFFFAEIDWARIAKILMASSAI